MSFTELVHSILGEKVPQKELALRIGYSQSSISKILSGTTKPNRRFIQALVKGYSLSDEQYRQLMTAAEISLHPLLEQEADQHVVTELSTTLIDPALPQAIKDFIAEDVQAVIGGWKAYLNIQKMNHHRDWSQAKELAQEQLEDLEDIHDRLQAYIGTAQARALIHLEDKPKAQRLLERTAAIASSLQDNRLKAMNYVYQGNIYRDEGNWEKAITLYEKARTIHEKLEEEVEVTKVEQKIAIALLFGGNHFKARLALHNCVTVFKKHNNLYEVARTYNALAWSYNLKGDWEYSIKYHTEALSIAQNQLPPDDSATQYLIMLGNSYLGNDYRQNREPVEALARYRQAHDMSINFADTREQGWILLGLARVYGQLAFIDRSNGNLDGANHHYSLAIEHFDLAVQKNYQFSFWYRLAMTQTHYARFLLEFERSHEDFNKAERALHSALEHAEKIGSKYYQAQARVWLCDVCRIKGDEKQAEFMRHVQAVRQLHDIAEYPRMIARLQLIQAHAALNRGSNTEAVELLTGAFDAAIQYNDLTVTEILNRLNRIAKNELLTVFSTKQVATMYTDLRRAIEKNFKSQARFSEELAKRQKQLLDQLEVTASRILDWQSIDISPLD